MTKQSIKSCIKKILTIPEMTHLMFPAAAFFLVSIAVSLGRDKQNLVSVCFENSFNLINMLGGHKLFIFFTLLLIVLPPLYICFRLRGDRLTATATYKALLSILMLSLMAGSISFFLSFSVNMLFRLVPGDWVMQNTAALDSFERSFYGTIPGFDLIKSLSGSSVEKYLLFFYKQMFIFSSLAIGYIALKSPLNFRRVFYGYFLAFLAAYPLWVMFPATSPDGLYFAKIFANTPIPKDFESVKIVMSEYFVHQIEYFHTIWIGDRSYFNVSSMPSLHVAWTLIFSFYLYCSDKRMLIPAILWLVLTTVGTFYSLQHYLTDVAAGIVLAIAVLFWTQRIIRGPSHANNDLYYFLFYFPELKNQCKYKQTLPKASHN